VDVWVQEAFLSLWLFFLHWAKESNTNLVLSLPQLNSKFKFIDANLVPFFFFPLRVKLKKHNNQLWACFISTFKFNYFPFSFLNIWRSFWYSQFCIKFSWNTTFLWKYKFQRTYSVFWVSFKSVVVIIF
jgi:hypothetical protein